MPWSRWPARWKTSAAGPFFAAPRRNSAKRSPRWDFTACGESSPRGKRPWQPSRPTLNGRPARTIVVTSSGNTPSHAHARRFVAASTPKLGVPRSRFRQSTIAPRRRYRRTTRRTRGPCRSSQPPADGDTDQPGSSNQPPSTRWRPSPSMRSMTISELPSRNLNAAAMDHAARVRVTVMCGRGVKSAPRRANVDVERPCPASDAEDVPDLARIGPVDADRVVGRGRSVVDAPLRRDRTNACPDRRRDARPRTSIPASGCPRGHVRADNRDRSGRRQKTRSTACRAKRQAPFRQNDVPRRVAKHRRRVRFAGAARKTPSGADSPSSAASFSSGIPPSGWRVQRAKSAIRPRAVSISCRTAGSSMSLERTKQVVHHAKVIHRAALEVSAVAQDLFANLIGGKRRGRPSQCGACGPLEKSARPRQADRVAQQMIAPQVPFDVAGQVVRLPPEARKKSTAKVDHAGPPRRSQQAGPSESTSRCGWRSRKRSRQEGCSRGREVAAIDPSGKVFREQLAGLAVPPGFPVRQAARDRRPSDDSAASPSTSDRGRFVPEASRAAGPSSRAAFRCSNVPRDNWASRVPSGVPTEAGRLAGRSGRSCGIAPFADPVGTPRAPMRAEESAPQCITPAPIDLRRPQMSDGANQSRQVTQGIGESISGVARSWILPRRTAKWRTQKLIRRQAIL